FWFPPESAGLTLLDKLRLLQATATARATPAQVVDVRQAAPGRAPLTDREQQVYRLVADGLTNREIGERLYIGRSTVKTNVARIKDKLGVTTRGHLITSYHRSG